MYYFAKHFETHCKNWDRFFLDLLPLDPSLSENRGPKLHQTDAMAYVIVTEKCDIDVMYHYESVQSIWCDIGRKVN